ncbi:MAG: tRNA pseudouridine(55) synthase TruB [Bacteroidales bacterium]|nr:tRNA pseudouridine(55) synthase TruB [Bacteroidales bacterium]
MEIYSGTNFLEGQTLLFDKPLYWTSFDLVKKVKNIIRKHYGYSKIKVGHAGTLDPLASGLMIICTGKNTKKIPDIQGLEKEYIATLRFGETTPSFDLETEVNETFPTSHLNRKIVLDALNHFIGEQDQVPPIFSAKKIDGKRAYEFARKGVERELKPVRIWLYELELISFKMPLAIIRIKSSKGTYIRSFARDLGLYLNSGACLVELKRTRIGDFSLKDAFKLTEFEEKIVSLKQI